MKKLYPVLLLIVLSSLSLNAQQYFQYFDGADTVFANSVNIEMDSGAPNIWQIGPPQKIIFDSASTTPNAIVTDTLQYYPVNNVSRFRTLIDNQFFPWGVLAFQWNQKLDFAEGDGGIVEFSTDHGVTWENAFNNPYVYNFYGYQNSNYDTLPGGEYAFSGTDSSWRNIWLCFDLSWLNFNPDTLRFRFTALTDSVPEEKEGWMIDNMMAFITGIHTVKTIPQKEYLMVYPNPATDRINIQAQKRMDFHIIEEMELVNSGGQTVRHWKNVPTKFWIDTKDFPDGDYILRVKTNIKTETRHVMICKGDR